MIINLAVCLHVVLWTVRGLQAGNTLFSQSFQVVTNIFHHEPHRMLDIRVKEIYSQDQARAVVDVSFDGLGDFVDRGDESERGTARYEMATYYTDAKSGLSLVKNDGSGSCRKVEPGELLKALYLDFDLDDHEDKQPGGKSEHIIGPAKWIKFVTDHREHLSADLSKMKTLVRNVESVAYTMTLPAKPGREELKLRVFYPEMALVATVRDHMMPNRITIASGERISFIDIHSVTFLSSSGDTLQHTPLVDGLGDDAVELDDFILSPASGCSLLLEEDRRKTLFELRGHKSSQVERKFSFRALVKQSQLGAYDKQFGAFVAYDHRLEMMRVDLASGNDFAITNVIQIFNFRQNRMFHILREPASNNHVVAHLLSLDRETEQKPAPPAAETAADDGEQAGQETLDEVSETAVRFRHSNARCASAQVRGTSTWRMYSFGQLLWGADSFVYLGRARVRGIKAKVYEATGTEPPYWLEQVVDYDDTSGEVKSRQASDANSPVESARLFHGHLITLVYMSDEMGDDDASNAFVNDRVLLMQIYRMDSSYKLVLDKRAIIFQDFTWTLATLAPPSGSRGQAAELNTQVADLFSLADYCAAPSDSQLPHGRVEMLLKPVVAPSQHLPPEQLKPLQSTNLRNLATLASLQSKLNLPVNLIYDLETKLISSEPSGEPTEMFIAFNVARRSFEDTGLTYIGRGERVLGRSWFFSMTSFFQCFMLAAHRRVEVHFAYQPTNKFCYVSTETAEHDVFNEKMPFDMMSKGGLEVYRTRKLHEQNKDDKQDLEFWARKNDQFEKKVSLRSRPLCLHFDTSWATKVEQDGEAEMEAETEVEVLVFMKIERFKVRMNKASRQPDFIDKIDGFGLVKGVGDQASGGKLAAVSVNSFAHCQSRCFHDADCRAYSFCIRSAQAECLLSQTSFSSPKLVSRLLSSDGQQVTLDEAGIRHTFKKHANCAIYNHLFLDHFFASSAEVGSLHRHELIPGARAEDCARECFRRNLNISQSVQLELKHSVEEFKEILKHQPGEANGEEGAADLEVARAADLEVAPLKTLAELTTRFLDQGCYSFYFLERIAMRLLTPDKLDELRKIAGPTDGGYCAIHARDLDENGRHKDVNSLYFDNLVRFDSYEFLFTGLYVEERGVSLVGSTLSKEEQAALLSIRGATLKAMANKAPVPKSSADKLKLVSALLQRGENLQLFTSGTRDLCASMCFKQTSGLWPACKSFDLTIARSRDRIRLTCAFNSITKAEAIQAKRWDLIDNSQQDEDEERWHYEPKLESTADWQDLIGEASQLEFELAASLSDENHSRLLAGWFAALLGIASGLTLGLYVGLRRRLASLAAARRGSQSSVEAVIQDGNL